MLIKQLPWITSPPVMWCSLFKTCLKTLKSVFRNVILLARVVGMARRGIDRGYWCPRRKLVELPKEEGRPWNYIKVVPGTATCRSVAVLPGIRRIIFGCPLAAILICTLSSSLYNSHPFIHCSTSVMCQELFWVIGLQQWIQVTDLQVCVFILQIFGARHTVEVETELNTNPPSIFQCFNMSPCLFSFSGNACLNINTHQMFLQPTASQCRILGRH